MNIQRHARFKKHFQQRIAPSPNLVARFYERVTLFVAQPSHPLLNNHALVGKQQGYRSFSITGDIRVVYYEVGDDTIVFADVGTHNQVY